MLLVVPFDPRPVGTWTGNHPADDNAVVVKLDRLHLHADLARRLIEHKGTERTLPVELRRQIDSFYTGHERTLTAIGPSRSVPPLVEQNALGDDALERS
jgi:hypothetical protein